MLFRKITEVYKEQKLTWLWLITYSDLMTNLMLFFLMSYTLTIIGGDAVELAAKAFHNKLSGKEDTTEFYMNNPKLGSDQEKAMRIVVCEEGMFDSGDAELKPESIDILHKIAEKLRKMTNVIIIVEGHTDNIPIRGKKYESNWELSAIRAENVVRYLVHKEGFPPELFAVAGYGEFRPVADNNTESGRKKNRRIELVILPKKTKENN